MKKHNIVSTLTVKLTEIEANTVKEVARHFGENAASRAMILACQEVTEMRKKEQYIIELENQLRQYTVFRDAMKAFLQ